MLILGGVSSYPLESRPRSSRFDGRDIPSEKSRIVWESPCFRTWILRVCLCWDIFEHLMFQYLTWPPISPTKFGQPVIGLPGHLPIINGVITPHITGAHLAGIFVFPFQSCDSQKHCKLLKFINPIISSFWNHFELGLGIFAYRTMASIEHCWFEQPFKVWLQQEQQLSSKQNEQHMRWLDNTNHQIYLSWEFKVSPPIANPPKK